MTEKHENLAAALAAFQKTLPTIAKGNEATVTSTKGNYKYSYADLSDISPVVLPLLGAQGLAWSAQPTLMGDNFVLHYSLSHESGEVIEGVYPLPSATTPAQQLGSAITYARRYALCAITGVAPGGDDDDAASAPAAQRQQQAPRLAQQQRPAAAPQAPIAPPALTQDWFELARPAKDRGELRAVYERAQKAGELGVMMPDLGKTVDQFLRELRTNLPEAAPAVAPAAVDVPPAADGSWSVAQIPGAEGGEPT